MLAGTCKDLSKLKYPVLATPKLDGIRCLITRINGQTTAVSRNWKPIPNEYVRNWLQDNCPVGFDGELIVPDGTFQDTSSAIMRRSGKPKFEYQVFDYVAQTTEEAYSLRIDRLRMCHRQGAIARSIKLVLPTLIQDVNMLELYEQDCLTVGYEGVMVRQPDSPYKNGRSTEREQYLLKIKRFVDAEAVIVGCEERVHNANELEQDELGRAKRSSHKANMVPMDTLGALKVVLDDGVVFRIGTGFTDQMRAELWAVRDQLVGKIVKFKYQPTGVKDAPRFPVFLGVRSSLS
jgi:DNA ligase-1